MTSLLLNTVHNKWAIPSHNKWQACPCYEMPIEEASVECWRVLPHPDYNAAEIHRGHVMPTHAADCSSSSRAKVSEAPCWGDSIGKLACSETQGRRVIRLTPALINTMNYIKHQVMDKVLQDSVLEASALVYSNRARLPRGLDACCR